MTIHTHISACEGVSSEFSFRERVFLAVFFNWEIWVPLVVKFRGFVVAVAVICVVFGPM